MNEAITFKGIEILFFKAAAAGHPGNESIPRDRILSIMSRINAAAYLSKDCNYLSGYNILINKMPNVVSTLRFLEILPLECFNDMWQP